MSRKGDCWDNAVSESFFKTLKVERVNDQDYWTREEAKTDITLPLACGSARRVARDVRGNDTAQPPISHNSEYRPRRRRLPHFPSGVQGRDGRLIRDWSIHRFGALSMIQSDMNSRNPGTNSCPRVPYSEGLPVFAFWNT